MIVIGYGSELRGDDAVGPQAAREVESWNLPGVQCLAVHQLTPDLADLVAEHDTVVFVDASCDGEPDPRCSRVEPGFVDSGVGHTGDPPAIMALTNAVYGRNPEAWLVAIPGERFDIGEEVTPTARRNMESALKLMRGLLESGVAGAAANH